MGKNMTTERLARRLRKADDRAEMRDTETHTRLDEVQQSVNAVSKALGTKGEGWRTLVEALPGNETVMSQLRTVKGQGTETVGMLKAMARDLSLAVGTSKSVAGALATATEQTWERLERQTSSLDQLGHSVDALANAVKHRQDNLQSRTLNELRDLKEWLSAGNDPKSSIAQALAKILPELQGINNGLANERSSVYHSVAETKRLLIDIKDRIKFVRDSQTKQETTLEALAKALLPEDADERSYRMILSDLSAMLTSIRPNAARAAEDTSAMLGHLTDLRAAVQHLQEHGSDHECQSSGVDVASFAAEITLEDDDLTTLLAELDSSLRAVVEGQGLETREQAAGYAEMLLERIAELRREMHGLDSSDLSARQQAYARIGELTRQLGVDKNGSNFGTVRSLLTAVDSACAQLLARQERVADRNAAYYGTIKGYLDAAAEAHKSQQGAIYALADEIRGLQGHGPKAQEGTNWPEFAARQLDSSKLDKLAKALTDNGGLADDIRRTNGNVLTLLAGTGDLKRGLDDVRQVAMQTRGRVDQGRNQLTDLVSMLSAHYQSHSSSIGQVRSRTETILEQQDKTHQRLEAMALVMAAQAQSFELMAGNVRSDYAGIREVTDRIEKRLEALEQRASAHSEAHQALYGKLMAQQLDHEQLTEVKGLVEGLQKGFKSLEAMVGSLEQRDEDRYHGLTKHLTEVERKVNDTLEGLESGKYQQAL